MRVSFALMLTVGMTILSCSDSEEDPGAKCDTYYLASLGDDDEFHYNSDGLVSDYIVGGDTLAKFEYNADKLIRSRKTGLLEVYFYYDQSKKIKYVIEYYNGSFRDSIGFVFDSQNLITSLKHYTYYNFNLTLTSQDDYEYTNRNSTKATHYKLDSDNLPNLKLFSFSLFEYDNKKVPFPKETWPFYYFLQNGAIFENNVTKSILKREGFPDSESNYSYQYNNDGYPTHMKIGPGIAQNYVYTCEPKLRGN